MTTKIAVIGCGGWGKNIVRTLGECGALAAIYDANPQNDTAKQLAAQFSVPFIPQGVEAVIASPYRTVAVATPDRNHHVMVGRLLEHDFDVFVEKPLTMSLTDAVALFDHAAAKTKVLMVGHLLRYHPAFEAVLQAIPRISSSAVDADSPRQSALVSRGITAIESIRHDLLESPRDSDLVSGYAVHDLSLVVALIGDRFSSTDQPSWAPQITGNPHRHLVVDFTLDATAIRLDLAWDKPRARRLRVVGDEGEIIWENETEVTLIAKDGTVEPLVVADTRPLTAELLHFINCVETRSLPLTSGEEVRQVTMLLEGIDQRTFAGDNRVAGPLAAPLGH
ncbi:MAG: Gfo/Idh/MocA family oxidoreductase [Alphaproteobacteria bacterium]|nr:Gfo/Idh/MocA family oxidoreductase [Alphaproteobacteria bacterium]